MKKTQTQSAADFRLSPDAGDLSQPSETVITDLFDRELLCFTAVIVVGWVSLITITFVG